MTRRIVIMMVWEMLVTVAPICTTPTRYSTAPFHGHFSRKRTVELDSEEKARKLLWSYQIFYRLSDVISDLQ